MAKKTTDGKKSRAASAGEQPAISLSIRERQVYRRLMENAIADAKSPLNWVKLARVLEGLRWDEDVEPWEERRQDLELEAKAGFSDLGAAKEALDRVRKHRDTGSARAAFALPRRHRRFSRVLLAGASPPAGLDSVLVAHVLSEFGVVVPDDDWPDDEE